MKMNLKKISFWFLILLFIFVLSTFLHECGHGFSNQLNGVSVSTGFNRVGNVFSFPHDSNFRVGFDETQTFLLDYGVPITLILTILFTTLLCMKKNWKSSSVIIVAGFSLCNAIIRLVPCSISVISTLITQSLHVEDEIQTGQLLAQQMGVSWIIILPLLISISISIICLVAAVRKCKKVEYFQFKGVWTILILAYITSFFLENYLDNILRINWII